jgi:hypothetical protein
MTVWDDLGASGAAFAQLAEAREHWTNDELALELYLHGYARTAETFNEFKRAVHDDLSELQRTPAVSADLFGEAIVLQRLRHALLVLDELTPAYVLREWAKLAAREADRQDAAGRHGAARLAEAEALESADAAAAARND